MTRNIIYRKNSHCVDCNIPILSKSSCQTRCKICQKAHNNALNLERYHQKKKLMTAMQHKNTCNAEVLDFYSFLVDCGRDGVTHSKIMKRYNVKQCRVEQMHSALDRNGMLTTEYNGRVFAYSVFKEER